VIAAKRAHNLAAPNEFNHLPNLNTVGSKTLETHFTGYLPTKIAPNHDNTTSEMFYWFIESRSKPSTDPIVIWIQGGPFCSGTLGLFLELGPYKLYPNTTTAYVNPYSWNSNTNLLMFDNPVGTGFSSYSNNSQLVYNQEDMAKQLYSVLINWFQVFPHYINRPLFLTGESYAGKFIPYLATEIDMQNDAQPVISVNLKGMAIGDGWSAPLIQTSVYAQQAYYYSMIDENELRSVNQQMDQCSQAVNSQQWHQAQVLCDNLLAFIVNCSGGVEEDDVRLWSAYDGQPDVDLTRYLNLPAVQQVLGVKSDITWVECAPITSLSEDEMKDAAFLYPALYMKYRVLWYNGNFDLNVGAPGTEAYLRLMLGDAVFFAAKKRFWVNPSDKHISGYVKDFIVPKAPYNLTFLIVADAGHLVRRNSISGNLLENLMQH
jgi:carboxypeptidase C (cathepsin A)